MRKERHRKGNFEVLSAPRDEPLYIESFPHKLMNNRYPSYEYNEVIYILGNFTIFLINIETKEVISLGELICVDFYANGNYPT